MSTISIVLFGARCERRLILDKGNRRFCNFPSFQRLFFFRELSKDSDPRDFRKERKEKKKARLDGYSG